MKTVKLSFPTQARYLARHTPGRSCLWNDYRFLINQEVDECDYWVVYNSLVEPIEKTVCPPGHTVFITGEPATVHKFDQRLIDQFAAVVSVQPHIKHKGLINTLQVMHWALGVSSFDWDGEISKDYDEEMALEEVKKTKLISIITSNKMGTAGHRRRYYFAWRLKKYFGDDIDLFGRGINDFGDTWDVLAPYKYSVPIENCSSCNYVTEKLFECYLAHTFPIYYGAPNLSDYIATDSFVAIDIKDFEGSVRAIKNILNDPDHYNNHLQTIIETKRQYLREYSLFAMIAKILDKLPADNSKQSMSMVNYSANKTVFLSPARKYAKKIVNKFLLPKIQK